MNDEERRSTQIASACAASMVGWQVAGSAIRDSSFLTHFDVTSLPLMIAGSAAASMAFVGVASRAMSRISPGRFMVRAFAGSAAITAGLAALSLWQPGWAAIGLYVQIAVIGAVLLSGFWSVVNERFDPRAGKRSFMIIGRAASAGGLLGGVAADRVAATFGHGALLPMLVLLHAFCAMQVGRIDRSVHTRAPESEAGPSAVELFRKRPYLRNLGLLVLLLTLASGLVDYWFKAQVVATWSGDELVGFFAWFYTGMSLFTFAIQMVAAHTMVKALGLARVTSLIPAVIVTGGVAGLFAPGIWTAGILRVGHTSLKHSVFRLAYELLFIPLDAREKRKTKAFIDVGFGQAGEILGAGLVAVILLTGALWSQVMLVAMIGLALCAIGVSVVLDRGYVRELEASLVRTGGKIDPYREIDDALTAEMVTQALGTTDLSKLDQGATAMLLSRSIQLPSGSAVRPSTGAVLQAATPTEDRVVQDVAHLRSGDPKRVRRVVRRAVAPELTGHLIPLLAWDAVARDVAVALSDLVPRATGQLVDALVDPDSEFAVRRRIPRILRAAGGPRAVEGLLVGLEDERFEVRFQCSRALLDLRRRDRELRFDPTLIEARVVHEAEVDRKVWEGRRLLDAAEADGDSWLAGDFLKERASRSMEHVFALLALAYPVDPLIVAFHGLHTEDPALVGTAIEYLEHVLSPRVRRSLWPLITDRPASRRPGSTEDALDALLQSHQSIQLHLKKLQSGGDAR